MTDQTDNQPVALELDGETARKLFVGGLSWQTTEDGLQKYLGTLGLEVERVLIMRDKLTGRSRGFGFVIMTKIEMLDKAVSLALQLDGRKIEAKRAIPKRDMGEKTSKKIFVGGIPISLSASDFKKFFEQFGVVSDCQVMTERESGRSRGFGFVTFQDEATLETVLATQHSIQGKPVEVKRAEPKKVEKLQRPIILPVPYFPSGYPYSAVGFPPNGAGAGSVYGQPLTIDPNTGYLVASPLYTPQLLPMGDDAAGRAVYEQYYFDPATSSITPLPASTISSTASATAPSNSSNEPNAPKSNRGSRREVVGGPKGDYENSNSSSTLSLVDRVRANEVRKKRGMSDPEPERPKKTNSSTISSASAGRKVVTGNWRSKVTTGTSPTTTATTSPTTAVKEGGALHKYFQ